MKARFVTVPYSRIFPYPLDQAYAWLTDYQDDDPQRTTAVIRRRDVVKRDKDVVTLDATIEAAGRSGRGVAEVHLFPPDRWEARIVEGKGRGTVYEYRLTPIEFGVRLDVAYRFRVKRVRSWLLLQLGRRRILRELNEMWDGFAASMRKELG